MESNNLGYTSEPWQQSEAISWTYYYSNEFNQCNTLNFFGNPTRQNSNLELPGYIPDPCKFIVQSIVVSAPFNLHIIDRLELEFRIGDKIYGRWLSRIFLQHSPEDMRSIARLKRLESFPFRSRIPLEKELFIAPKINFGATAIFRNVTSGYVDVALEGIKIRPIQ